MSSETATDDPVRTLHNALRAAGPDDLADRIGDGAIACYEERVAAATFEGADTITDWWRTQPPAVLEALLEVLAEAAPFAVHEVAERTEATGAELLTELLRDDGEGGARRAYERLVRRLLDRARETDARRGIPGTGALSRAVEGLDPDTVPTRFSACGVARHGDRMAAARRDQDDAVLEVMRQWRGRHDGARAIEDIVATLEREYPEDFDNATRRTSAGNPAAELEDVLRDERARARYKQLLERVANAMRTA